MKQRDSEAWKCSGNNKSTIAMAKPSMGLIKYCARNPTPTCKNKINNILKGETNKKTLNISYCPLQSTDFADTV